MTTLVIGDDPLLARDDSGTAPAPAPQEASPACELCGQPVGTERLEALPRATTCFPCANRHRRPSRGRTCS